MTRQWYGRVVGVVILGAIASLVAGAFVILFLGIGLLALFNGGHSSGKGVDHAVWLASVAVGPLIVGGCTGGLAATIRWPEPPLKRRTATAIAVASAVLSGALLGGHTNGSIRFLVQPWWWAVYVIGVLGASALMVRLWGGGQGAVEKVGPPGPISGPAAGWFADPLMKARWRWWDGRRWTHHEAD